MQGAFFYDFIEKSSKRKLGRGDRKSGEKSRSISSGTAFHQKFDHEKPDLGVIEVRPAYRILLIGQNSRTDPRSSRQSACKRSLDPSIRRA